MVSSLVALDMGAPPPRRESFLDNFFLLDSEYFIPDLVWSSTQPPPTLGDARGKIVLVQHQLWSGVPRIWDEDPTFLPQLEELVREELASTEGPITMPLWSWHSHAGIVDPWSYSEVQDEYSLRGRFGWGYLDPAAGFQYLAGLKSAMVLRADARRTSSSTGAGEINGTAEVDLDTAGRTDTAGTQQEDLFLNFLSFEVMDADDADWTGGGPSRRQMSSIPAPSKHTDRLSVSLDGAGTTGTPVTGTAIPPPPEQDPPAVIPSRAQETPAYRYPILRGLIFGLPKRIRRIWTLVSALLLGADPRWGAEHVNFGILLEAFAPDVFRRANLSKDAELLQRSVGVLEKSVDVLQKGVAPLLAPPSLNFEHSNTAQSSETPLSTADVTSADEDHAIASELFADTPNVDSRKLNSVLKKSVKILGKSVTMLSRGVGILERTLPTTAPGSVFFVDTGLEEGLSVDVLRMGVVNLLARRGMVELEWRDAHAPLEEEQDVATRGAALQEEQLEEEQDAVLEEIFQ